MSVSVEHAFRHHDGRLVATLVRRLGAHHLALAEDAVQQALLTALDTWPREGEPREPEAWLFAVAHRRALDALRRTSRRSQILERASAERADDRDAPVEPFYPSEIRDDLLRMLFVCCDPALPTRSQVVLALHTLCGFRVAEIAQRTFTSEANVHKRLARARAILREAPPAMETPSMEALSDRLPQVHRVLYQLFNEGHLSLHPSQAIRRELCDEAIRLATLLAEHPVGAVPEAFALLALMHLHVARLSARVDAMGSLLLLEEQDRASWDRDQIAIGMRWLARSARGEVFSRYHAEAGIAAQHALAPSFAQTRWDEVVRLYALLEQQVPSPLFALNRAIALAEVEGPRAALAVLDAQAPPSRLDGAYFWDAVRADLHRRVGDAAHAERHRACALEAAPTEAIRALLMRRLG